MRWKRDERDEDIRLWVFLGEMLSATLLIGSAARLIGSLVV
jgi:hypothetical protein